MVYQTPQTHKMYELILQRIEKRYGIDLRDQVAAIADGSAAKAKTACDHLVAQQAKEEIGGVGRNDHYKSIVPPRGYFVGYPEEEKAPVEDATNKVSR